MTVGVSVKTNIVFDLEFHKLCVVTATQDIFVDASSHGECEQQRPLSLQSCMEGAHDLKFKVMFLSIGLASKVRVGTSAVA